MEDGDGLLGCHPLQQLPELLIKLGDLLRTKHSRAHPVARPDPPPPALAQRSSGRASAPPFPYLSREGLCVVEHEELLHLPPDSGAARAHAQQLARLLRI